MKVEVKVPSVGESVNEVFIGVWKKKSGDAVAKDEVLLDLETQKATFELQADAAGRLEIIHAQPGTKVAVGDVIATIDTDAKGAAASAPAPAAKPASAPPKAAPAAPTPAASPKASAGSATAGAAIAPSAKKMIAERGIDVAQLTGSGKDGRILKEDVLNAKPAQAATPPAAAPAVKTSLQYNIDTSRGERREPATRIRRQIAENLVAAQHTAAILTTFNEVDMTKLLAFRKKHKDTFKEKHGVSMGVVGLFAMVCAKALKEFPLVNATYTGEDIIYRDFVDLSIAVSTDRGLVVPVLRDVDKMTLLDFEKKLADLSEKARNRKLSIPEMTGGTFTISNGGVFGSLLSTPILNMPQSAILGLHKTQDRPVAIEGAVVIRPMMYISMSYDHRIIDGKDAVQFLVKVKEGIENIDTAVNVGV
jgi:2-oxoglutarate dehydrogenase E2 component (dihydrolipoamide succinyltransferase)